MVCHTAILLKDDMAQVSDLQNSLAKNQTVLKNRACGYDEIRKFCHIDKLPSPLANPEDIDILEQNIRELSPYLLKILLQDKTTGRYIRWACDEYAKYGEAYTAEKEIFPELITGPNTKIIQPRIAKSKEDQLNRTRKSAEVFTPSWICAEMNNLCDEEWFGEPNVFNQVIDKNWEPTLHKISFKETNKRKKAEWQRYVDSKRLEITCGEAPFLVSRYDTTTGEVLPIIKRIGLLDRKLRIVNENTDNEADWFVWTKRAYESTYGYEYQGDNLLLARENLLWTFIDNYKYKFQQFPAIAHLKQIANVIAWNIWQMDGLKECAPFVASEASQLELFNDLPTLSFPIICRVKDWRNKLVFYFRDLKGDKKMKFDYVIGNPPYQVEDGGAGSSASPVYNLFVKSAKMLEPSYISMIIPARWMSGGKGLDDFRDEMLNDDNISMLVDYFDSNLCFPNVDISGGICYFLWSKKHHGDCKIFNCDKANTNMSVRPLLESNTSSFIRFNQAISIYHKIQKFNEESFSNIVSSRKPYGFSTNVSNFPENMTMNCNIKMFAYPKNRYVGYEDIKNNLESVDMFKVFIAKAYGERGNFPYLVIGKPFIGQPQTCASETYLQIGPFNSEREANNVISYMNSKFFRFLVLLKKNTQNAAKSVYEFVPMQNFSEDWNDDKLYKKYNLSKEEINFIDSKVRPMKEGV
nr:MAG TPA: Eco57I restriction-modification methylase [Caudoviricetes sp.]